MGRIRSFPVIFVLAVVSLPAFGQDVAVRASLLVDPSFDATLENPLSSSVMARSKRSGPTSPSRPACG